MNIRCKMVAIAVAMLLPQFAAAQAYPNKPIRVIVPVPAGGTPDVVARMVAPGYEAITWFGLLAPAKTPQAIIGRLNEVTVKVVRAPGIKSQLEVLGYDVAGSSPQEFAAFIRAESEKYARLVKLSGAKVD